MAGVKALRQRITSIGNIKKITRAMEMVATTKLRRFQDRAVASRPYTEEITGLMGRLSALLGEELADRPLFRRGAGESTLALVVASDRGLCGAYNANLCRALEEWRAARSEPLSYVVYGRRAFRYMDRRGYDIKSFLVDPALEAIDYRNAAITARMLTREFLSGAYKEVWMLYTAFESMSRYRPTWVQVLPIPAGPASGAGDAPAGDVLFEPDPSTVFEQLVPRYLETRVYNALIEALTSEYASRRVAMKNATDAATDMLKALRGIYNRKRQETITKELLDIVGGAEALR